MHRFIISSYIEESILNNRIDFALIEGIPESPQIIRGPLHERPPLPDLRQRPILSLREVRFCCLNWSSNNFILREPGSGGREILESLLTGFQIHLNAAWESVSTQAIVKAVAEVWESPFSPISWWLMISKRHCSGKRRWRASHFPQIFYHLP